MSGYPSTNLVLPGLLNLNIPVMVVFFSLFSWPMKDLICVDLRFEVFELYTFHGMDNKEMRTN